MNGLLQRLPHKAPALLLDDVVEVNEGIARCALPEALPPCYQRTNAGELPAALGLEAMAQAAALWMLWRYEGGSVRGMLVQCRSLVMRVPFLRVDQGLLAEAEPMSTGSATGLYQFRGRIVPRAGGEAMVSSDFLILVEGQPA